MVSEPTSPVGQGCMLFKLSRNIPPKHCEPGMQVVKRHMRLFPMRTFPASANGGSCLGPVFDP